MTYRCAHVSVSQPLMYDIRVAGTLDPDFADYVRGMTITPDMAAGIDPVTVVRGTCPDNAALVGILGTLGNFGLVVISVQCLGIPNGDTNDQTEVAQRLEPVAATTAGGVAARVAFSDKALAPFRKGGAGRIGAGTGLLVGGLLSVGGPLCMLVGAISGAIIGGLAASLVGRRFEVRSSEG